MGDFTSDGAADQVDAGRPPNILVIMADEHAPMFSGGHGHPVVRTPHLDRLAAGGAIFANAYCNSPLCAPSRMSFLTGRYVSHVEAWDNTTPLRSDVPTWAHLLRARGYDVALSGKQHFIGPDQLHGFSAQLARDLHAEWQHRHYRWDEPLAAATRDWQEPLRAGPGGGEHIDVDDQVEAEALAHLRSLASGGRPTQPWALCVSFLAPHFPFVAPQEHWDRYRDDEIDLPAGFGAPQQHHPVIERMRAAYGLAEYTEEQTRRARHGYYALISYLDDKVGRLLDVLDETGQAEDTLVVYLSDHGEMAGEHGLWRKSNFYEESVRVPLLMRWPRGIPAGQRRDEVVSLVDVTATLREIGDVVDVGDCDGTSVLPLLQGREARWPNRAFAEYLAHGVRRPMAMLRRDNLKLNHYHGERPELYDLTDDPTERHDRSADPRYADALRSMQADLLSDWDPDEIERRVRRSQAERAVVLDAGGWGAGGSGDAVIEDQLDRITGR